MDKLYAIAESGRLDEEGNEVLDCIYYHDGVFTTKEKAQEVMDNKYRRDWKVRDMTDFYVIELEVDSPYIQPEHYKKV